MQRIAFALTLLFTTLPANAANKPTGKSNIGEQVKPFTLKDYRGKAHSLADFKQSKLLVVAFLGTDCPLAKLYGLRLGKLQREYGNKGVAFIGVNANCNDSITAISAHARKHKIDFPVLKDLGNKLADAIQAERTPEVFLLDADRRIRYRGRVDDQYGIGYIRDQAEHAWLKDAIDALLAGKVVKTPITKPEGCLIARVLKPKKNAKVTYASDIASILHKRCVECHRPGEIAPFSLTTYKESYGWAEMIREVVHDKRMPPWHADPKHGHFSNARRMTKTEIAKIDAWVAAGAPAGDLSKAPKPPKFPVKDWNLPRKPDRVVYMNKTKTPYEVPAEGFYKRSGNRRGVPYKHFVVDPGFKTDKWIEAAEVVPGNRAVVHHILVIVRPPGGRRGRELGIGGGEFLAGYVPGLRSKPAPAGTAKFIPAGSKFVFQMHYTPIGSKQTDLSKIGLVFADPKKIKKVMVTTRAVNTGFRIPKNEGNHKVEATSPSLPFPVEVHAFMPHMHLRGKSFSYEARYRNGNKKMLLSVPNYDFNWQTRYLLKEPIMLPPYTRIHCVAHFDNSKHNLNNPDPNIVVRWGDQTWEEMMIGYFDILVPIDAFNIARKALGKKQTPKQKAAAFLKLLDANGDGKLARKEVPPRLGKFFDRIDRNKDGFLTIKELEPIARFLRR